MTVNPEKLTQELLAAGVPVDGCSSDGRIDYKAAATAAQRAQGAAILAAHDPAPTTTQLARAVPFEGADLAALFRVVQEGALAPAWAKDRVKACSDAVKARVS